MISPRALAFVALLGATASLVLALVGTQVDWGEPGTSQYATYELLNRALGLPMALMIGAPVALLLLDDVRGSTLGRIAAIGLLIGLGSMLVGVVVEFWLFSDAPYSGPGSLGRRLSFFAGFGLGGVLALLSMALIGFWGLRQRGLAPWSAVPLILVPVMFLALAAARLLPYASILLGVGAIGLGILLRPQPTTAPPDSWTVPKGAA